MIDLDHFPSFEWRRAMQWFDEGDPSVVAELILKGEPMALHVREFVADIATGKRKPPTAGKARKILNFDHKEMLRQYAMFLHSIGDAMTISERQNIKSLAIEKVVALSGVSIGTASQAWKETNSKWATLARKNKTFRRAIGVNREKQKELERLRALGVKNDPFNMER